MDAHALHRRGWTISAIARHLGHDRKTIRAYLPGGRVAGQRRRAEPDPFEPFAGYCRERLAEDPHLWATTLFDELLELGYDRSYPTFTRAAAGPRAAPGVRAVPPGPRSAGGGDRAPAGRGDASSTGWSCPTRPQQWGWGSKAFLLVGALAHSGRWRGVLAESTDQPHLIDALHRVCVALGGLTRTLAVRPDGHRLPPGHRPDHRLVRRGGQALRGVGGDLPGPARQPQGRGGEGQPHRRAALVAHPGRRDVARAGPGVAGPVVSAARRHPPAPDRRRAGHRGHRRRRRAVGRGAGAVPGRPGRRAGRHARRRWSPSAATTTRCHPSWPAPRSRSPTGSARRTSSWPPAAGSSSPATSSPRPGPAPPSATPDTSWPWNAPRMAAFTDRRAAPPQAAHPTRPGRPGRRRGPARPRRRNQHRPHQTLRPATAGEVVVDLARYAAAAQGRNTLR